MNEHDMPKKPRATRVTRTTTLAHIHDELRAIRTVMEWQLAAMREQNETANRTAYDEARDRHIAQLDGRKCKCSMCDY